MPALLTVDGRVFAAGRSRFLDSDGGTEATAKIFVKILPADAPIPVLAQVDTGAAWSVLDGDIAEALGFLDRAGPAVSLSTRSGTVRGKLIRSSLTLVADVGESCEVDATLFVSRDWTYGNSWTTPVFWSEYASPWTQQQMTSISAKFRKTDLVNSSVSALVTFKGLSASRICPRRSHRGAMAALRSESQRK